MNKMLSSLRQKLQQSTEETVYTGIANPSGAVALNNSIFIVADDEDNALRIYSREAPGKPLQKIELSKVFDGEIEDGDDQEIDLESAAEIDGTYFWLGSHSTSKKGGDRPARRRLFAVMISEKEYGRFAVEPAGQIYLSLLEDLQADSRYEKYSLETARTIPPKETGGLNIEGLAATPERTLLFGFRNPLAGVEISAGRLLNGKALVVELLNPFEVIIGRKPRLADPLELDLGGFGIREITWRKAQQYLIVAGPYHANDGQDKEDFRLYDWNREQGKINPLANVDLRGFNAEAAVFYPGDSDSVQLLSDDGKTHEGKSFRSREIRL